MQPSNLSPSEEYNKRLQTREQRVAHFEQLHIRYGNLRLSIVVATVVAAWFSLHREAFSPWWLLLFFHVGAAENCRAIVLELTSNRLEGSGMLPCSLQFFRKLWICTFAR